MMMEAGLKGPCSLSWRSQQSPTAGDLGSCRYTDHRHWRRNRGGGGGTGARAPLNFGHRGQGPPKFWGYSVEGCVRLQQLYVSIPEGKTTLEISYS